LLLLAAVGAYVYLLPPILRAQRALCFLLPLLALFYSLFLSVLLDPSSAAVWALVRFDMAAAFRNPGYVVLVFFGCVNAAGSLWFASQMYEVDTLPVTRVMIAALQGSFAVIPLIIAIYYAGELVWSSRDRRTHVILDVTPAPDWAFMVPKLLAITLVLVSTLAGSTIAAMVVQLLKGYTQLEFGHYLLWYVLPWSINVTLMAVLAVFVQTLVPNKQAGWLAMLVFIVARSTLGNMGFELNLYQYASAPGVPLSDMNGQGTFAAHAAWFDAYWSACALVLVVLTQALWRRGTVVPLAARFKRLPARLAGPASPAPAPRAAPCGGSQRPRRRARADA
jgi:hypothetical protein